jgi:hypothetical protein
MYICDLKAIGTQIQLATEQYLACVTNRRKMSTGCLSVGVRIHSAFPQDIMWWDTMSERESPILGVHEGPPDDLRVSVWKAHPQTPYS